MTSIGQFAHAGGGAVAGSNSGGGPDLKSGGVDAVAETAILSFAMMMAEEMLLGTVGSPAQALAKKLPGASENVTGQMTKLREEDQLASDRREISRMMSRKDESMNFRA